MPTYVLGTFYICFFCYQGYDIPVSGEAHCTCVEDLLQLVSIMPDILFNHWLFPATTVCPTDLWTFY